MAQQKKHENFEKVWSEIIKKSAHDEVFKQRLLKNPSQVLKDHGIETPSNIHLKVVENTATTHYLVLPANAKDLSEEDLRKVSGGKGVMAMGVMAMGVMSM